MKYTAVAIYIAYTIASTIYNAKTLRRIHRIKTRDGYRYDPSDITYEDNWTMVKIIVVCHISGIMGGIVGVAGGIILGPVFL